MVPGGAKGWGPGQETAKSAGVPPQSSVASSVAKTSVGTVSAQQGPTVGTLVSPCFSTVGVALEQRKNTLLALEMRCRETGCGFESHALRVCKFLAGSTCEKTLLQNARVG